MGGNWPERDGDTFDHSSTDCCVGDDGEELNLYDVLGVSIMATEEELRRSWKKLALRFHPDRRGDDPESTMRFQAIQHAYEVLKDRKSRNEYDNALLDRLFVEQYLDRFDDLILSVSGLGLPLEDRYMTRQQREEGLMTCHSMRCITAFAEMRRSRSFGSSASISSMG